jgi:hypothetical protein
VSGPTAVRVRMYQVGFGDCFLVSFEYQGEVPGERHMLVDFGRRYLPHAGGDMRAVAQDIKARTGGHLDLLVVSHRHEDHLSAFGSTSIAKLIEDCNPALVVRSWTEDPDAPEVAPGHSLTAADRRFAAALNGASALAERIAESRFALDRTLVGRSLRRFAFGEIKNKAAVTRLNSWSAGPKGAYLSFGSNRLASVLPGVEIEVLGPPTVKQYPAIASEANSDPDYWLTLRRQLPAALEIVADGAAPDDAEVAAGALETDLDVAAVPGLATAPGAGTPRSARPAEEGHASDGPAPGEIGPVRWLTEKVRKQQVASLLRIVRSLDDWLNNTSLILLIRAGDRRLLFPGDAQVENWRYALKALPNAAERKRIRSELAQVDLYKVGHHGSRNATPRSLFRLWAPWGAPDRIVVSLLSSKEGEYGESIATAVPLAKLMAALDAGPRRLISTLQDPANPDPTPFREVWAPTAGGVPFGDA